MKVNLTGMIMDKRFDVFFDLHLNKRLSKQPWAGDLRRQRGHYDVIVMAGYKKEIYMPHL